MKNSFFSTIEVSDFFKLAINKLNKSEEKEDIPVCSILVNNNDKTDYTVALNTREELQKIINHSEINTMLTISKKHNNWKLNNYTLFTTLFPCLMCWGAILESNIKSVYYLAERKDKDSFFQKELLKYLVSSKINISLFQNNDILKEYLLIISKKFYMIRKRNKNI